MANNNPQHLITGRVRLSYVHLFTPYAHQQGSEAKYSTTILLPKSDIATKQRIDAAVNAAIQAGISKTWGGVRPPVIAIPIYDGDGVRPNGESFGDECKGHWVFTASSKQQPQVVDLQVQPILNQSDVYSGIYARVSVQFFPYANSGKKGIGCGLGNVQKLEDGEPLGGRTTAADDFGSGVPQQNHTPAQTYQQQAYLPPAQQVPPQGYQQQQPSMQQGYAQPGYPQQVQQPMQQQVQIDPITGKPITGDVMGI